MTDHSKPPAPDRRLADIVREVKIAAADRTDVVVDMRDADRARLELLADEIKPILDDIDPADDRFDFGISPGLQPRLWIDAVAHVHMGRDRRVFRFVRDTRLGRVVISDSSNLQATADCVARYIAERVIERERILAGDFEDMTAARPAAGGAEGRSDVANGDKVAPIRQAAATDAEGATPILASEPDQSALPLEENQGLKEARTEPAPRASLTPEGVHAGASKPARGGGFALGASWFILGCVAGAAALVAAFWDRLSALVN